VDIPFVFDFDSHYYEVADAFTRYIDEEHRLRTIRFETGPANENFMFIDGVPSIEYPDFSAPVDARTGTDAYFEAEAHGGDRGGRREFFSSLPLGWKERAGRLEILDAQGVDAALLLPSAGVTYSDQVRHDPDLLHAIGRAFNRWLEDDWGYAHQGRLFAVPTIFLADLDQALDELERVLAQGARAVNLPVAPVNGESPAAVRYDPFWRRVSDAGLVVTFHLSAGPYPDAMRALWGTDLVPGGARLGHQSAFFWTTAFGDRPIMDLLTSLLYWNLFGRFPELRVVSIENGAGWVDYLLRSLDRKAELGRHGTWPGGPLTQRPSAVFHRHVYVVPFPEENLQRVVHQVGADRTLFGSDFPHPEGLADPMSVRTRLGELPDDVVAKVLGGNAAALMGLAAHR
jgi:predicted TIM-barrel fold metal-dependent hydrolase